MIWAYRSVLFSQRIWESISLFQRTLSKHCLGIEYRTWNQSINTLAAVSFKHDTNASEQYFTYIRVYVYTYVLGLDQCHSHYLEMKPLHHSTRINTLYIRPKRASILVHGWAHSMSSTQPYLARLYQKKLKCWYRSAGISLGSWWIVVWWVVL
jgi:hypothetical protein